jgi:hypothetical protein
VIVVGLGVSACSADDDDSGTAESMIADAPAEQVAAEGGAAMDRAEAGDASSAPTPAGLPLLDGRALATTAGVTVSVSDIRQAVDDTLTTVARNNATVFNADVNIGNERDDGSVDGAGWFVVKVPPADLDTLVADLGATVGTVSGRTQETSDVTEQLVDLEIRIGVERDVIDRFRLLLADASEFQDVVDIERVIAERTIALEQLLASQRNLENRVELSTLTIDLQFVPAGVETVDATTDDTIGDAWRAGWDAFAGVFFALAFALAVATPFLAAAAVVGGILWLVVRRRPRRRPAARAATRETTPVSEPAEAVAAPTREG